MRGGGWLGPFLVRAFVPGRLTLCAMFPHRLAAVVLLGLTIWVRAQAPLEIENLTDRSTHSLRAWFCVPSVADHTYGVLLDGRPVPTDLTNWVESADYHELAVTRTNVLDGGVTNLLVRLIVRSERGSPERGLIQWTPYPLVDSTAAECAGARLRVTTPAAYPAGLPIPVVAWVEDDEGNARRANGRVVAPGFESDSVQVRRGVGSGFLPPASAGAEVAYEARLHSLADPKTIAIDAVTTWRPVSGELTASTEWPARSRIRIDADLTVPAGTTLTVGAGSVIRLDPLVNITNSGRMVIEGTADEPVVWTAEGVVGPEQPEGAWGGFILRGAAAELTANHAIFAGGGGREDFDFSPGASHRSEQAVFLLHSGARAALTNCAILNTAGQVGNGYHSDLTLDHCLVQRAITSGEYVGGTIVVQRSALIEFPADNGVVTPEIADADYDGIYFTEGTHILRDSLIGFAMDDAVDSGSGGSGTVLVTNCWLESALHEAQAWSGEGRTTWTYDTVALNNGQGIECGWSTGDGSPDCFAERLLSTANAVGARFGDNYDWSYNGFLRLTNSLLLYNARDIFLKTWNAVGSGWQSASWEDRVDQVDFQNNRLSTVWEQQPGNRLWDAAVDGVLIAHWMSTPAEAPVGIGLALWTNALSMSDLLAGVPIRLSSFTTHPVAVSCQFEADGLPLATSVVEFAPGQTVRRVYPVGCDLFVPEMVQLRLVDPVQGELSGMNTATFSGRLSAPQVGCWVATNNLPLPRLAEGLLVQLSTPAGVPATVDYNFTASGTVLGSGTLTFAPGETVQRIPPGGVESTGHDPIRLELRNPVGASLTGITSVTYGTAPVQVSLAVTGAQQLDMARLADGLPLALNRAATDEVAVSFQCEGHSGALTNGTLIFPSGVAFQRLILPTVDATEHHVLLVSLTGVRGAELLPPAEVFYVRLAPAPGPVLAAGQSTWRYHDLGGDPGATWFGLEADDSGWGSGPAQLGFGDGDEATTIQRVGANGQNTIAFYFRQKFVLEDPSVFTNLNLWLLRDDGGVVYLNGTEVYRSPTLPPHPATIDHQTLADYPPSSDAPPDNSMDQANVSPAPLRVGTNVVAVEIHQYRADSSDISFDLSLTGEPTPPLPVQRLHWGRFGNRHFLVWGEPTFVLEQAGEVSGPWARVPGAMSPVVLAPATGRVFYRIRR